MFLKLLKSKLHHANVTFTDVNYHGSITIDADLMRATGLLPNEAVVVADCDNGNRFETYVIVGRARERDHRRQRGRRPADAGRTHRVIVMSFVLATPDEAPKHHSRVVICDKQNKAIETVDHPSVLE